MDLCVGIWLNLNVKPPKGKMIPIKADSNDTVGDLKKKIADKAGIPSKQQWLQLAGDPLEDEDKCLSDFDIPNDSTLDLTIRMPMKIFIQSLSSTSCKNQGKGHSSEKICKGYMMVLQVMVIVVQLMTMIKITKVKVVKTKTNKKDDILQGLNIKLI